MALLLWKRSDERKAKDKQWTKKGQTKEPLDISYVYKLGYLAFKHKNGCTMKRTSLLKNIVYRNIYICLFSFFVFVCLFVLFLFALFGAICKSLVIVLWPEKTRNVNSLQPKFCILLSILRFQTVQFWQGIFRLFLVVSVSQWEFCVRWFFRYMKYNRDV